MTKADRDLIDYIVVCISEFANRYGMHVRDAYDHLNCYKGIDILHCWKNRHGGWHSAEPELMVEYQQ